MPMPFYNTAGRDDASDDICSYTVVLIYTIEFRFRFIAGINCLN